MSISRPERKSLSLRDEGKEESGEDGDREGRGREEGCTGLKWSWTTGDHGNDLWLIVATDRHGAQKPKTPISLI